VPQTKIENALLRRVVLFKQSENYFVETFFNDRQRVAILVSHWKARNTSFCNDVGGNNFIWQTI